MWTDLQSSDFLYLSAERMSRRVRKTERFALPGSMASEAEIFTKELTLLLDHMQKSPKTHL